MVNLTQSNAASIAALAASVGTVDVLINNAGILIAKPLLETADDDIRRLVDIDFETLNLDYRQNGLGSAACGPGPWEQYLLKPEPVRFRLCLSPACLDKATPWALYRSVEAMG